eukprot:Rmarinus@m.25022
MNGEDDAEVAFGEISDRTLLIERKPVGVEDNCEKNLSLLTLAGINAFEFAYGLCVSSYLIITLPAEAERLFLSTHAIMLGVFFLLAGISQLAGPIAGRISDNYKSVWGKRRPFLIGGLILAVPSLICQWWARTTVNGTAYLCSFFVSMVSINVMYSAGFAGLIPDLVPSPQRGEANGVMALLMLAGACSGFGVFSVVDSVGMLYPIYIVVLVIGTCVTCISSKERPLRPSKESCLRCITWRSVKNMFTTSPARHGDFFWVFLSRGLYYLAISQQTFMLYYFRDVVRTPDPQHYASLLALIGQIAAAPVAYPAGKLSDRVGRVPLVVLACALAAAIYMSLLFTRTILSVLAMGILFGAANGAYLAVDYALAVDTLPSAAVTATAAAAASAGGSSCRGTKGSAFCAEGARSDVPCGGVDMEGPVRNGRRGSADESPPALCVVESSRSSPKLSASSPDRRSQKGSPSMMKEASAVRRRPPSASPSPPGSTSNLSLAGATDSAKGPKATRSASDGAKSDPSSGASSPTGSATDVCPAGAGCDVELALLGSARDVDPDDPAGTIARRRHEAADPSQHEGAAQALGLWGIAAFVGTMFGPMLSGPLLYLIGRTEDPDRYSFSGYVGVLLLGAASMLLSGYVLKYIRHVK